MWIGLVLLSLVSCVAIARAQDSEAIDGRAQIEWREEMAALERSVERAREELAACEEREAPAAYDAIDFVIRRGRRGRLYGVEVTRCDDARAELAESVHALEDYEDMARASGVPPGWLR